MAQRKSRALSHTTFVILLTFISWVGAGQFNKAAAQTASFRSVDANSDGVLSLNELIAAFGEAGARRLLEDIDSDGDNRITIIELRGGKDNEKGGNSERRERGARDEARGDREDRDEGRDNENDGSNDPDRDDDRDDSDDSDDSDDD